MTYSELCSAVKIELSYQGVKPPINWRDQSEAAQQWRKEFIALLQVRGMEADWATANEATQ